MMRLCSYCGCEKFYNPLEKSCTKASGFMGAKCWECYLIANATTKVKNRATPEGRLKANQASSAYRKKYPAKNSAKRMQYYTKKLKRIPPWANLRIIKDMYAHAARLGLEVDHIIPLNGELVSGLHTEDNLQLISKSENSSKGNRFDPANFSPLTGEPLCL